jgi:Transposase DDE domain
MVANRALAPSSKLYCYEQWLKEDIRIEDTQRLELHHLYRAMDFLEANKEMIEKAIYFRMADLLNLDVELVFYDTTSLHFEIDEPDRGVGANEEVRGSRAAGDKIYRALRKRGNAKNGRYDAPQIVVGLAVTRDGFPLRHWIFPGNTVDVTTVASVKEDLKGWQLSRCVFVGDAGMVSAENLTALARAGGKYIVCMPIHRGGQVAHAVLTRPGRYQEVAENLQVKRSSAATASAVAATWSATTRRRPSGKPATAQRSSQNSPPRSKACMNRRAVHTASACASCAPPRGMVATSG